MNCTSNLSNLSLPKLTVPVKNFSINNSHFTNLTKRAPLQPNHRSDAFSWSGIILVLSIVGCAANFLVLYSAWPKKNEKSGVNLLILHCIIANLLFCLIHYPQRFVTVLLTQLGIKIPIQFCYVFQDFNTINWLVLFWADAFLALNRCVALFLPHSYQAFSSPLNNVIQIASMWLSAVAMTLPANFGSGDVIMIPMGHCVWRLAWEIAPTFAVATHVYRTAPVVLNGAAALLILGKCYWLSRTGFAAERARDRTDGSAGPNPVRQRVRLALVLVLMYVFASLTNQSTMFIIFIWPNIFMTYPTANLWVQIPLMAQYAFSACFFLVGNRKYWERVRGLIPGSTGSENSNNMGRLARSTKVDVVVSSKPETSLPPASHITA